MPVIPHPETHRLIEGQLPKLLADCQARADRTGFSQIVSFSVPIEAVDPLGILQAYGGEGQHFYWENRERNLAIAAWGSIGTLKMSGSDRFIVAQQFVDNYRSRIQEIGESATAAKFFCGFSFFDTPVPESNSFPGATVFLPQFEVLRSDRTYLRMNWEVSVRDDLEAMLAKLRQQMQKIARFRSGLITFPLASWPQLRPKSNFSGDRFQGAVQTALAAIERRQFEKVVLAHAVDLPLPLDRWTTLDFLRQQQSECNIFSFGEGRRCFIGASPERLFSLQDKYLSADAIAGSIRRGKTQEEDRRYAAQLCEREKEQREHEAVSNYIAECLRGLGLHPQVASQRVLKLAQIQHLLTPIRAQVPTHIDPLEIVARLHPTPAVAGVEKEAACEFIRQHEGGDRSLYAAPIGWVDTAGNAEFIVGIRSALIAGDRARLYAGAGIVSGSHPQREWEEVQLKLQAMYKALG